MSKQKTIFVCQVCGYESLRWLGKCPSCGEWNTFAEEEKYEQPRSKGVVILEKAYPKTITEIEYSEKKRISTNLKQIDSILNGGLVQGQVILLAGEPGIGKSTLMLQIANSISKNGKLLYVNSEESNEQVKIRSNRLNVNSQNLLLYPENRLEDIIQTLVSGDFKFLIIDSIQNIYSEKFLSSPGSVTQVREATSRITEISKYKNITTFIVGHINKEGMIAGPKAIEHIVDTIIMIDKDNKGNYRVLRTVKNRFGPTNSIAIYSLSNRGLEDVPDISTLVSHTPSLVGSVLCPVVEGVRSIVVEVQSLVNPTQFGFAKRTADGIDINRLYMLSAILDKYLNTKLSLYDIYLNITTGFEVKETATDLAVALSILSSLKNKEIPRDIGVFGEIGLGGEIRPIPWFEIRISELQRIGVKKAIVPKNNKPSEIQTDIQIVEVENVYDILSIIT
ncbi:MAG: DNA repair protein RadA [Brevinematales bacterium]|nr:DNA repair protein RadA [Brevinematales bacterium]